MLPGARDRGAGCSPLVTSATDPVPPRSNQWPSQDKVREYLDLLSNWGKWGPDDELGTLHYLDSTRTQAASALVVDGVVVSCSLDITYDRLPDDENPVPAGAHNGFFVPSHFMIESGEGVDPTSEIRSHTADVFLLPAHGLGITHIDAPCHTVLRGTMYNGHPANLVRSRDGAAAGSVELVRTGVVGRGVLLDVASAQGRDWLDDGAAVLPDDLEASEEAEHVRCGSGDVVLVRTGYRARKPRGPSTAAGPYPGLQAACLPWLHERQTAVLGTDTAADVWPHGYLLGAPIHTVGMWAMGLWIIDNCALETLAAECRARGRWEFLLVVAPLVLTRGTGSPVNPLAIF